MPHVPKPEPTTDQLAHRLVRLGLASGLILHSASANDQDTTKGSQ